MKRNVMWAAALSVLLLGGPALADFQAATLLSVTIDGSGTHWQIIGTTIRLFEPPVDNPGAWNQSGLWRNNNWSPVTYPPDIQPPYVPAPGRYNYDVAEGYDLEGLFYKYAAGTGALEVWLVTSMGPDGFKPGSAHSAYSLSVTHFLGDLFIDVDGGGLDYALLSFNAGMGDTIPEVAPSTYTGSGTWNGTGRDAGALVSLSGNRLWEINGPYSYQGNSLVEGQVNPWAVVAPPGGFRAIGTLYYEKVSPNDGIGGIDERDEGNGGPADYALRDNFHATYVYKWSVIGLPSGLDPHLFTFHITTQCGNDLLVDGTLLTVQGSPAPPIPVPGALALGVAGLSLVAGVVLRRRRAA